jgi:hypothetical protein
MFFHQVSRLLHFSLFVPFFSWLSFSFPKIIQPMQISSFFLLELPTELSDSDGFSQFHFFVPWFTNSWLPTFRRRVCQRGKRTRKAWNIHFKSFVQTRAATWRVSIVAALSYQSRDWGERLMISTCRWSAQLRIPSFQIGGEVKRKLRKV